MEKHFIGIVGSLRKKSFNRSLMRAAQKFAPEGINIENVEIGDFPLFNQDREKENYPENVQKVKDQITAADGVLFVTPEYNRSVPGVLKNAIDWLSRPPGTSPFKGKPVLVIGASTGQLGTAIGQYHLKQSLLYLDARVLGQPEFYLSNAGEKFDEEGNLTDDRTRVLLIGALERLAAAVG
ncbi:MAG TPA: NADPH-dependent FMN reductase [Candidatus Paceibacterota bacterium]|nr:NADPH-dependent FMN reductase [Candidatus Paceibacterota bacterium]